MIVDNHAILWIFCASQDDPHEVDEGVWETNPNSELAPMQALSAPRLFAGGRPDEVAAHGRPKEGGGGRSEHPPGNVRPTLVFLSHPQITALPIRTPEAEPRRAFRLSVRQVREETLRPASCAVWKPQSAIPGIVRRRLGLGLI